MMEKLRLWYFAQPRAIRKLLLVNVVVYLAWNLGLVHFRPTVEFVYNNLALNPTLPDVLFNPWQLVTYSFLHLGLGLGGFLHILFNMLWMMWIGREYEQLYGPQRLFALYMIGSVSGAIMTVVLHAVFPEIGAFGGIVNGASGAVLCIMTAVSVISPDKSIGLLFIGIVRLKYIVIGFLALDILWSAGGSTSISAHWGGALSGYLFARTFLAGTDLSTWASPLFPEGGSSSNRLAFLKRLEARISDKSSPQNLGAVRPVSGSSNSRTDESKSSSNQSVIDSILDKISEKGYEALSDKEKRALYEAGENH